jgi:glutathione synthase/RimK-type ligase-like ATP-grasp enzyme
VLKPADGGGWKDVSIVNNPTELMRAYDASNQNVMTLQEFIDFEEYVRCICIGRDFILPIQYDPKRRCYIENDKFLSPELEQKVLDGPGR